MKEQRDKILEQGRNEGKEDLLQKIANTSVSRVSMPFKI